MESRSNRSASPTSRTASTYNGFTFAVPPTPQLLRSADTSAPDLELGARPNETSSSGTLSTPYSSLIATPISGAGPITAQSRNERRTPVSPASQGSSGMVLRTASSRPPFAFFPPPESNHHGWTNPPTPLSQNSPSKAEESSVGDENQDEKFIRPTDTDMVPTAPGSSLSQSLHMIGEDDSPYPEVRASVANTDDPDMPTLTFRMWFIGITLCLVRTSLALFFSLRWPSPWISDTLVIIVAYPFGKALDRLLPFRYWTFPRALPLVGGLSFGLNPGPFNIKEHTLVFIMSFISDPPIYGFMLIVTAEKHYGTPLGTGLAYDYPMVWKMGHLPITGYSAYDRFALPYDIHRVLTPTVELNVTAYEEYSPVYLPVTFAGTYLLAFMLVTSVIIHTILNEGHAIIAAVRRTKVEEEDIHARLMRRYPEVLSYYYMSISVIGFSMLIGAIKDPDLTPFKLQEFDVPIWSIFLATLLALIYIIPCAYVYAKSGTAVPINLLAELIPGALLPGRPFANMGPVGSSERALYTTFKSMDS
ncbi:hypothetical protein FRC05_004223 [Tulasnella sp. 425]|nr:hypothetical protein FRC05_004223 [Tulasnella sp. 425]